MTPNWFATIALLLWPVVALWLYCARPVNQATAWTILGAQLLLPVGAAIKFDMIPAFDKNSIPSLAALVGCMLVVRRPFRFWSGFELIEILLLTYFIGPLITSILNEDALIVNGVYLPGVGAYDGLSAIVSQLLFFLPFFLGRQLLRSSTDNEEMLRVLAIAALLYSVPMLFEVRMSPQLHYWLYGATASSGFVNEMRYGGFRPTVFMQNGLVVAFFTMTAVVAMAALCRTQTRVLRLVPNGTIMAYLSAILVLCKSAAVLVYGAALVPLVRWAKPTLQLRIAMVLVSLALLYPTLRTVDLFPTVLLMDVASSISDERADSLKTRFDQEHSLLDRQRERFWFGWGRFGRMRIFDTYSKDISITDGRWIITMGQFGFLGFLAEFGVLALPVFYAASALKHIESTRDSVLLAALALIVAISVVDQLPNASLSPWTWLLVGALLGRTESLAVARQISESKVAPEFSGGKARPAKSGF